LSWNSSKAESDSNRRRSLRFSNTDVIPMTQVMGVCHVAFPVGRKFWFLDLRL
jgi:hypothetical protein